MKTRIFQATLMLGLACSASASILNYYNGTGGTIQDYNGGAGNPLVQTIVSTDPGVVIDDVSLVLNISGGFNGDLYGYLTYNDGSTEKSFVFLNRMGGGSSAASGSGFGTVGATITDYASLIAAGVNLTDSASANIHAETPGSGQTVTVGNYVADNTATFAGTFGGMSASGTWSLVLFDRATGDEANLVAWGLQVVPEPTTWAAIIFGIGFAGVQTARWARGKKLNSNSRCEWDAETQTS